MATLEQAPTSNFWSTSLNGAINDSVTTITLNSTTGLQAPGRLVINRQDSAGTNTPSSREVIAFTGISGSDLTGVTRGADNSTARSHADGSLVESAIVVGNWDTLYDVINEEHDLDGTHDTTKVVDLTTLQTLTNKIISSPTITGTPVLDSTSAIPFYNDSMHRQAIINGNFDVWQRGTSFTNPATGTYSTDRWKSVLNYDSGTPPTNVVHSRQLLTSGDIPNAFYHYRIAPDGAGSSFGNSAYYYFSQFIENGTRLLCGDGKKVTVSFWARSSIANKRLGLSVRQSYGSGGSPTTEEIITGEIITLTSSWAKYTHTYTTNTLSGKTFGTANDDSLKVLIYTAWGTTTATNQFGGGTAESFVGSGNIDIAQVQLCAGDVALPFMPKSFEEELRACQRYYEKSFNYSITPTSNGGLLGVEKILTQSTSSFHNFPTVRFRVSKRIPPSPINLYNPSAATTTPIRNTTDNADVAGSTTHTGENSFVIYVNSASIAAAKELIVHWTAEAEL